MKAALEEQTGVVTRRTALLDHRNILPARANQQVRVEKRGFPALIEVPKVFWFFHSYNIRSILWQILTEFL